MDQSAPVFQRYRPLSDGCFRLLLLQPSKDGEARIECELAEAQINERPYEALSYVWGQEEAIHTILVDGEEVWIRSNLYDALKGLRLPDQQRTLWVDSICINQSNIDERNSQVKQMGLIYSSAVEVIIWLGNGDDKTAAALDFIDCLARLDPAIAKRLDDDELLQWEDRERVFRGLDMVHGLDNHDEVVSGLMTLINNVWWKRMWTLQEIVLSKSAKLICGSKSASWVELNRLATFALQVAHYNTVGPIGRPMDEAIFDEVTARVLTLYIAVTRLSHLSHSISDGSEILLEKIASAEWRTRQATDPRDMVYALLGLTTEKEAIDIDYRRSKNQVYTATMKVMLEQSDKAGLWPLHILQECSLERETGLPSWVPDLSILHSNTTTTLAMTAVGASFVSGSLYNASLGDAPPFPLTFHEEDTVLEVEGASIDQVQDLGIVYPQDPGGWKERDEQLKTILKQWLELTREQETEYIGGGSSIEAFWRTVTFDLLLEDREYLAGHPNRRDRRLPKQAPGMPPATVQEELEVIAGIVDAPVPKSILEKLNGRRLLITKGGYIGVGPASMQTGDLVCLLRGSIFPSVVRPVTDNRYTYIGEAFVHGIMDGEIIEGVKNGTHSWQPFFLI